MGKTVYPVHKTRLMSMSWGWEVPRDGRMNNALKCWEVLKTVYLILIVIYKISLMSRVEVTNKITVGDHTEHD